MIERKQTYPLFMCGFSGIAGAGEGVSPGSVFGQLCYDSREEELSVEHEAGHVHLHWKLLAILGATVDLVCGSVCLCVCVCVCRESV